MEHECCHGICLGFGIAVISILCQHVFIVVGCSGRYLRHGESFRRCRIGGYCSLQRCRIFVVCNNLRHGCCHASCYRTIRSFPRAEIVEWSFLIPCNVSKQGTDRSVCHGARYGQRLSLFHGSYCLCVVHYQCLKLHFIGVEQPLQLRRHIVFGKRAFGGIADDFRQAVVARNHGKALIRAVVESIIRLTVFLFSAYHLLAIGYVSTFYAKLHGFALGYCLGLSVASWSRQANL